MSSVAVLGGGYVGLTTAVCLSTLGNDVVLVERDPQKAKSLSSGIPHFYEPGLELRLSAEISSGRLRVVKDSDDGVRSADFVFICLPTPQAEDGSADTSIVFDEVRRLQSQLAPSTVLITKSTMPLGSSQKIREVLDRPDVHIVVNPEFLREGSALSDALNPARIVIGSNDRNAGLRTAQLFSVLETEIVITDPFSAELAKYASNAFLAMKVSFVNSLATICTLADGDVHDVTKAMGLDPRIGPQFLQPGPGWGGSCFPKDTSALLHQTKELGFDFSLVRATIESNSEHQKSIIQSVIQMTYGIPSPRIGVLGLTFKAGTDDLRDSPALTIIDGLLEQGLEVVAFDPMVDKDSGALAGSEIDLVGSMNDVLNSTDILLVLTEWPMFASLEVEKAKSLMRSKFVLDCRNLLNPLEWRDHGFQFRSLGRPAHNK